MNNRHFFLLITLLIQVVSFAQSMPGLQRQGNTVRLVVEGKPFLMLGGELGNSSASDMEYMEPVWPKIKEMHLNTLLASVYWELVEPEEGHFDFTLVDAMIKEARKNDIKLVFLWFGSWKNSMSCYVPGWVKTNPGRFPRAVNKEGEGQEILTPFHEENLKADKKAFRMLLSHIRDIDEKEQTVVMVQVENEIGMLPDARDYHPKATKAFRGEVPPDLIRYLEKNRSQLVPGLKERWEANGMKVRGSWEEVFGKGLATDEIFIAWYFAKYTNEVTRAGKEAYPLPMYVNAALNRPGVEPGDYPSGGPLPHLMDIWKAAAPEIDFLSPDFYNPRFRYWNDLYTRKNNPLFIPEIRFEPSVGARALYAVGHYHALGFSPFSIESTDKPGEENIGKSYAVLEQLSPLILENAGSENMKGVWLDKNNTTDTLHVGGYTLVVKHDHTLGWSSGAEEEVWPESGALCIETATGEFTVAGTGVVITFFSDDKRNPKAGIARIEEGRYENGEWKPGRRMNGDQSHQGRHLRIPVGRYGIQKVKLYTYK